ncbi:hypothetical protein BJ123_102199 [Rhodopseudomonas thermotolerans]|uniref:VWFA domain-containing protein n=2 Tax=Rhodopseudomonas TaxID=1073 RepID=A0A336JHZ5_9BRAD|nr:MULTISPECIES: vWA domain-containing protein [Rhodopseudomonas]RED42028.1 hypothetical protein BJ125_102197 [Rhodopseudomonas pentothenatexigens]REG07489.1 hypothetical protein BJ123_102199 [Rhodopseudomonas thermotolerans]SSW89388.1 hypothetical protein SAMN05892882_102197 [Rhodopseudomonas pentothenatexigens]
MTYSSEISRDNPTAILFVIDQSHSMNDKMSTQNSKASFVADVLNRTIYTLVTNCSRSEGIRDYFHLGVIGYGEGGASPGLGGVLAGAVFHPISAVAAAPLRVEDRLRSEDDGAGGIIERKVKFPVWFEAKGNNGTPMNAALLMATEVLAEWCETYPTCYPPTVLHVTDGESGDGDPSDVAAALRQISTNDGPCLLFNAHVSSDAGRAVQFPSVLPAVQDKFASTLFNMSSVLPSHIAHMAVDRGYNVPEGARGYIFNADPRDIVNFFEIGTRPRLTMDR